MFVSRQTERCPDCDLEGRIDAIGLPRVKDRMPLRPQSQRIGGKPRLTTDSCENPDCVNGRVPASSPQAGRSSNDPMENPTKG